MTVQTKPLADVTRRAFEVLSRELGVADTIRFVNQFMTGLGDYTADRDRMFEGDTLETIIGAIQAEAAEAGAEKKSKKGSKGRKGSGAR